MSYVQLPRPTREFYECDARAVLVRNTALKAAEALGGLMSVGREEWLSRLLDANSELRKLGIEPGMHSFEDDDPKADEKVHALQTNPVLTAEYAAGFTSEAIEYFGLTDGDVCRVVEEHDVLQGEVEGVTVLIPKAMSHKSRLLTYGILVLQRIENLLDAPAGPSEH